MAHQRSGRSALATSKLTSTKSKLRARVEPGLWGWYWGIVLTAVGLTPLVFGYFYNSAFELPKLVLVYGLVLLAIGLLAGQWWVQRTVWWPRTWLEWPLVAFLLLVVLSTIFGIDWYTSVAGLYSRYNNGLLSLVAYSCLFYLTLMGLRPPGEDGFNFQRLRQLLWVWLGSAGVVAVLAVLQHVGFNYICLIESSGSGCAARLSRAISTIGQPNWLAAYMIAAVPIGIVLGLTTIKLNAKAIAWILAALSYAALWYAYSRAAWLGLAAAVVVLAVCVPWKAWWQHRWWVVGLAIVCLVVSLTSFDAAALRAQSLTDSTEADPSTTVTRLYVWGGTIPYILDHPVLGTGPTTFAYAFPQYRPRGLNDSAEWNGIFEQAHNEVLNRAATTGIPSLIAWLGLFGVVGVLAWRGGYWGQVQVWYAGWRQKKSGQATDDDTSATGILELAILAGIIGIFVAQLFGFSVVVTNVLLFVGLAVVAAPWATYSEWSLENGGLRFGLVAVLVLVFGFGWVGLYRYSSAEALDRQGNDLSVAQTPDLQSTEYVYRTAADDYTSAIQQNPLEAHYHADLASLYGQMVRLVTAGSRPAVLKAADDQLQQAMRLNSHDMTIKIRVANVYADLAAYDKQYWPKTLAVLQSAKQEAPTSAAVQMALADTYLDMGNLPEAKAAYAKLVQLRPDGAETYSHRADYWQKVGNTKAERQDLEKALQLADTKDQPAIKARLAKLGG